MAKKDNNNLGISTGDIEAGGDVFILNLVDSSKEENVKEIAKLAKQLKAKVQINQEMEEKLLEISKQLEVTEKFNTEITKEFMKALKQLEETKKANKEIIKQLEEVSMQLGVMKKINQQMAENKETMENFGIVLKQTEKVSREFKEQSKIIKTYSGHDVSILADYEKARKELQHQLKKIKAGTKNNYNAGLIVDIQDAIDKGYIDKADELINYALDDFIDKSDNEKYFHVEAKVEKFKLLIMSSHIKNLQSKIQASAKLLEGAFETLENELPNVSKTPEITEQIVNTAIMAGAAYFRVRNLSKSSKYTQIAINYARQYLVGGNSFKFPNIFNDLFVVCIGQEKYDEAKEFLDEAKKIIEKSGNQRNRIYFEYYYNLATLYALHGGFKESEKILNKMIEEAKESSEYVNIGKYLTLLAGAYVRQENYKKAKNALKQALEIYKKDPESYSKDIKSVQEMLDFIKKKKR